MIVNTLGRWTVRSLRVAALTAGLAVAASAALAQNTSAPTSSQSAATKRTFTKNTTFNLPIQMDERVRATLSQVQLFVKSGAGEWVRQEVVTPQTPHFTYRVPQDGEYWFALVTVDRAGKSSPSDINATPPALRVIVDTRAPVLDTAVAAEGGEHVLRVNVIDVNPDPQSIRAFVLTEQGDRALTPLPGGTAGFRLSPSDLHLPIRVTAADMSGNQTTKDLSGRDLAPHHAQGRNDNLPITQVGSTALPSTLPPPLTPAPASTPTLFTPPPMQVSTNINNAAYRPAIDAGDRPHDRKIINTTHASIDYRIDKFGPSGVGRVDIYLTPDKGQHWTKIAEDHDKRTPAEVDLQTEGLFGIRLAITNGNGFGGTPPKAGDRPSFFIEVDMTSPFVQLQTPEMVAGSSAIDIRWTARDNNLAAEPVGIFYRTRPEGAWQPVTPRNVKNDGVFRWVFPRDIGPQFYLKLEVADLAGNVTKVETPTPIQLDMSEPEATLVDVTGVQNRSTPPPAPPTTSTPPPPVLVPGRN